MLAAFASFLTLPFHFGGISTTMCKVAASHQYTSSQQGVTVSCASQVKDAHWDTRVSLTCNTKATSMCNAAACHQYTSWQHDGAEGCAMQTKDAHWGKRVSPPCHTKAASAGRLGNEKPSSSRPCCASAYYMCKSCKRKLKQYWHDEILWGREHNAQSETFISVS